MSKIAVIVEGDGEVTAAPALIYKLLHEKSEFNIHVSTPKNAHGCGNLTKPNGIEKFVQYASLEKDCEAVLVLIDGDTLGDCPLNAARTLAVRLRGINCKIPIAIVVANREYEAWFIASIESISGNAIDSENVFPDGIECPPDPEVFDSAKGWISRHLPHGKRYKETVHQVAMTRLLDLNLARSRSRSFRRLSTAIDRLIFSIKNNDNNITP